MPFAEVLYCYFGLIGIIAFQIEGLLWRDSAMAPASVIRENQSNVNRNFYMKKENKGTPYIDLL